MVRNKFPSQLLLPEIEEDEFKALEVAERLKKQLKKLELIRILSEQMLKRKRLGVDIKVNALNAERIIKWGNKSHDERDIRPEKPI